MKQQRKNLITTTIVVATAIIAGAANASDHRMWREQVPLSTGPAIEFESESVDPAKKGGNDSLLWREQVKLVDRDRVFIAELALNRHGVSNNNLMWREQIRTDSAEPVLTAARDPQSSDGIQESAND